MAKIAMRLPDELLAQIERDGKTRGETRSEFFRRAALMLGKLRAGASDFSPIEIRGKPISRTVIEDRR